MDGPVPPSSHMNGRGGPPPSPPVSVSRSSNGTGLYPEGGPHGPHGGPPGRKYNIQALEAQLADHHRVLKDYLAESLRLDKTYMPHKRARDKLLQLSVIQFQELSTDVYDELLRREDERVAQGPDGDGRDIPRFLLPKKNFHPKRNQARQKLSTLPQKKFRELATDVLFELERRFPRFTGAERVANRGGSRPPTAQGFQGMRKPSNASSIGGPYSPSVVDGRATPGSRQFQSNTMVPNKGVMVEDDDASVDGDDPFDFAKRSSRRTTNRSLPYSVRGGDPGLEARIEELESQLNQKDKAMEEERERSSNVTSDLEKQISNAKSLNSSLQAEIDRMRADREADDWREKYEHLEQELNSHRASKDGLESELYEHRQAREALEEEITEHMQAREAIEQEYASFRESTEDIRTHNAESMRDIRSLAEQLRDRSDAEESLAKNNVELKEQLEDLKSRHVKTRAHLRSLKASSTGLYIQQPTAAKVLQEDSVLDSQGAIHDVSVTKFQLAVDELLQLARAEESGNVFGYMHTLVASVRGITNDVSKANPRGPEDFMKRRKKLEARIASTTNHLISVCKNHAVGQGLAPVALVDAAASHLSAAVVDYVKLMKVRPSYEGELEDHDDYA
ncbi:MAG: hypothetical protein Q9159_005612 [Coniocarpon cinnabarinum]